ncbi:alpha/beta hydrolase, partial [Streptomyces sp. NPDC005921]
MRDNFRSKSRVLALASAGALVTATLLTGALAAPASGAEARKSGRPRTHARFGRSVTRAAPTA